jgi:ATP-dependent Clp protease protease subunit
MTNLRDNHTIKVFGEIDIESSKDFISELIEHSSNPTQEITILLNSEGGCVYSTFAMHDVMRDISNPILVIGVGHVMSAACLLLAAGDTREVFANTSLMMHELTIEDVGGDSTYKVGDLDIEVDHSKKLNLRMCTMLAQYSGRTAKSLMRDLNGRDFHLTAKEAKEYGLVDNIRQSKTTTKNSN